MTNIDSDDIIKRDKVEARVLVRGFGCALFVSYFSFSGGRTNEKSIVIGGFIGFGALFADFGGV
ncbi:MAG: hypothetical protein IJD74_05625 [Clostridia bacterium]|nr:hypothetical protein [Clostridia bacterium]